MQDAVNNPYPDQAKLKELQKLAERLPTFKDTGEYFIPGVDECYAVVSEVAWADGAYGLTVYREIMTTPVWDSNKNQWVPDWYWGYAEAFLPGWFSTLEAAAEEAEKRRNE